MERCSAAWPNFCCSNVYKYQEFCAQEAGYWDTLAFPTEDIACWRWSTAVMLGRRNWATALESGDDPQLNHCRCRYVYREPECLPTSNLETWYGWGRPQTPEEGDRWKRNLIPSPISSHSFLIQILNSFYSHLRIGESHVLPLCRCFWCVTWSMQSSRIRFQRDSAFSSPLLVISIEIHVLRENVFELSFEVLRTAMMRVFWNLVEDLGMCSSSSSSRECYCYW